jgi:DUF1680 family protein
LVYCLEAQDQAEDVNILDVQIDPHSPLQATWDGDMLGGLMTVEARGYHLDSGSGTRALYQPLDGESNRNRKEIRLVALPYYAWGNRGIRGMRVWIPKAE